VVAAAAAAVAAKDFQAAAAVRKAIKDPTEATAPQESAAHKGTFSTSRFLRRCPERREVIHPLGKLETFLDRRLTRPGIGAGDEESPLMRALAASILRSPMSREWQRRPSLCHDGTPILVSVKLSHARSDAFRILIEPGSLAMTVAQQIAFSLKALDRLLGLLSWRSATPDLNAIIAAVLPTDAGSTAGWWGGMWLGAAVIPASAEARPPDELRVYLNLRHGDGPSRWQRLAGLFSYFPRSDSSTVIEEWMARLKDQTSPVGLGIVVVRGQVGAIRVYVVANSEESMFITHCQPISPAGAQMLTEAYRSFVDQFGPPSQTVTIGYDFIRDQAGRLLPRIGRVKVEVCCQRIEHDRRVTVTDWVERVLADWLLDPSPLRSFTADVEAVWGGCDIQHVSLGFAPHPEHVTVYVKPCSETTR
jgi:hypothetical protein